MNLPTHSDVQIVAMEEHDEDDRWYRPGLIQPLTIYVWVPKDCRLSWYHVERTTWNPAQKLGTSRNRTYHSGEIKFTCQVAWDCGSSDFSIYPYTPVVRDIIKTLILKGRKCVCRGAQLENERFNRAEYLTWLRIDAKRKEARVTRAQLKARKVRKRRAAAKQRDVQRRASRSFVQSS